MSFLADYFSAAWASTDSALGAAPEVAEWLKNSPHRHSGIGIAATVNSASGADLSDSELAELKAHSTSGVDIPGSHVLAWYSPFYFHGEEWGVTFNDDEMLSYASSLTRQLRSFQPANFFDVLSSVRAIVHIHELSHFSVEWYGATSAMLDVTQRNWFRDTFSAHTSIEEPICEARSMNTKLVRKLSKAGAAKTRTQLVRLWAKQPFPWPYSDWPRYFPAGLQSSAAFVSATGHPANAAILLEHAFAVGIQQRAKIPTRYVLTNVAAKELILKACSR